MRPSDIKELLTRRPFEPIEVGLSDGRAVLIKHPDQVVVSERHLIVGLASVRHSRDLSTPTKAESVAKDWLLVNLIHIVSAEPANGRRITRRRHRK